MRNFRCGVERVKRFVNVHLDCNVSNMKRISKKSTFPPGKLLRTPMELLKWFRNSEDVVNSLSVDPLYLRHDSQSSAIDYRNWQIPLGRRFRSIKLWFVMRMVGLEGLRSHVRRDVAAAKYLESLVREDDRFEIVFPVTLGLVCIRVCHKDTDLKINNDANEELYKKIQEDRRVHLTPSAVHGKYFIRISMTSSNNNAASVENCWQIIKDIASHV